MSKPKNTQQSLAASPPATSAGTALAPTSNGHDELAGLDVQFDSDGLEEAGAEDLKIAAKVLNFKGTDPRTGRKIPEDAFYDTVDETTSERLDAAFLDLHKTNLWSKYDDGESRMRILCRSFDRVTGTMEDGTERPCKSCPDAEWRTVDGKRTRNCGPVYNVFAIDRETQLPFVIRFKRTSMPVIKSYLQKHFLGRRVVGSKRMNYPLFAFRTEVTCKMSDDGKYSLPVLTRGEILSAEEIQHMAVQQRFLRENMISVLDKLEVQAEARDGAPGDTSFDTEKFTGDAGKDFVDAPAS